MEIKLAVIIDKNQTTIELADNQGAIEILNQQTVTSERGKAVVYLLVRAGQIVEIGRTTKDERSYSEAFDKVIRILPPWEIELEYLEQLLVSEALELGLELATSTIVKVPASATKTVGKYLRTVMMVLETFGYQLKPIAEVKPYKAKPAKAQHRWNKEVSQIDFYINSRESQATVLWQKRNEMLIKAGAKMKPQAELNKDGSVGFSAKMGEKIRSDHQAQINNFTTIEDIILKSVNEVGLFLYFGGTNSWLELVDAKGKSIDEYTVVN